MAHEDERGCTSSSQRAASPVATSSSSAAPSPRCSACPRRWCPPIAAAVESSRGSKLKPAVWLDGGLCTGCTESMAQSTYPTSRPIVLDILSVNYMETIMMAHRRSPPRRRSRTRSRSRRQVHHDLRGLGHDRARRQRAARRRQARPRGAQGGRAARPPRSSRSARARSTAAGSRPTRTPPAPPASSSTSQHKGIATPVINLPTCPVNPEWIVAMVVDVLLLGKLRGAISTSSTSRPPEAHLRPDDPRQLPAPRPLRERRVRLRSSAPPRRPRATACTRWAARARRPTRTARSSAGTTRSSWCVESGSPCIGCGNFNWVDENAPFLEPHSASIGIGSTADGGCSPTALALVAGGVVARRPRRPRHRHDGRRPHRRTARPPKR